MIEHHARLKNATKVVISCLYFGISTFRLWISCLFGRKLSGRLVILYYHGVRSEERIAFARQMAQLQRYSEVVSPDLVGFASQSGLYTAVTFDDAFSNLLENALPEMYQRSIPATIFVPVGLIGKVPTWDMSAESRLEADCVMTESQLANLLSTGITLGSHTVSHPRLSKLDDSEARGELRDSKEKLEGIFNVAIPCIAFPYGDYSEHTLELCREVGYRFAFTIEPAVIDPSNENLLRGRVAVNPADGPLVFYLKIHGAYSWMPYASRFKKLLASTLSSKRD